MNSDTHRRQVQSGKRCVTKSSASGVSSVKVMRRIASGGERTATDSRSRSIIENGRNNLGDAELFEQRLGASAIECGQPRQP